MQVDRGAVSPVPTLRRNPTDRRIRLTGRERYACRLPKGLKPSKPGEIVQVDTLFVNVRPDKAVLPPKRPQLAGAVERAQGSWRYEFYG